MKNKHTGLGRGWPQTPYYLDTDMGPTGWELNPSGFAFGQRLFSYHDAVVNAIAQEAYREYRAENTDIPEYKYITPTGIMNSDTRYMYDSLKKITQEQEVKTEKQEKTATANKKLVKAAVVGALFSWLFKAF